MTSADRARLDKALDWVRRIHDQSFSDWEDHVAWLEADTRNSGAFDEALLLIEAATIDLAPAGAARRSANDNRSNHAGARPQWRRWSTVLGAVAAAVIVVVAVPSLLPRSAGPVTVQTGPGQQRSITVDGTGIALNGETRLRLDRARPRLVVLEQGEALFRVRHDAAQPFEVQVGDARFRDVGTAFDVVRRNGAVELAVADGAVLYDPDGVALRLDGGQAIRIAGESATVQPIERSAVGGWTAGRLHFRDAPLLDVAGDVSRSLGEAIAVDPALAGRRFSGVVLIEADHARTIRRMAAVMDVTIRPARHGWQMVAPGR